MSSSPQHPNASSSLKESNDTMPEINTPVSNPIDFKVWNPPTGNSVVQRELPDSYFEPTTAELKELYQSQVRAREALTNAPLKTQEMRDREAIAKISRWPTTTIRVRFPDRTQLEKSFASTDKIKSVYAFVRNLLREDFKSNKFVLYQTPPRKELRVSDPKVRDLSLSELQLAPSSVLHLAFLDDPLNDVNLRAPLIPSVLARSQDLPLPPQYDEQPPNKDQGKASRFKSTQSSKDRAVPKWFKVGQKK